MNEARDIVKLALPFIAGVLSFYCFPIGTNHPYFTSSISLILLASTTAYAIRNRATNHLIRIAEITVIGWLLGVFTQANSSLVEITSSTGSPLSNHILNLGKAMQECIDKIEFNSSDTNALLKALLTGNRNDIPKDITHAFRTSGASHILALSGLHLGIIYLIISKLLLFLGNSPIARIIRSILCIAICSTYTMATGAGASIARALIFVIIAETARLIHRKPDLKCTLSSSLIIHLIIWPGDIRSIGFQLSYAAIAGIAWIYPLLSEVWPKEGRGIMKRIWNGAALSISCQLTTAPLAWFYFGTFPQYFLLTNLISLPLTSIIIPLALLTTTLNIIGICPSLLIQGTEIMVNALCSALTIIANM